MRNVAITIGVALLIGSSAGCGDEVCITYSGRVEVMVNFSGFNVNNAVTLEIESTVTGPPAGDNMPNYYDRRIGTMAFPEVDGDGDIEFIFDPGGYIASLADVEEQFTFTVVMRVYDADRLLLAEGRFNLDGFTDGCYLDHGMNVSNRQTCDSKSEGDPCVGTTGNHWVCMDQVGSLGCVESTCGDGFTDRRNGELCDIAAADLPEGVTCDSNCLPLPIEKQLWEGTPLWHEVILTGAPPARGHAASAVVSGAGGDIVVMFGGEGADGTAMADTWTFDGATWTEDMGAAPPARSRHAMAADPVSNTIILFGGRIRTGFTGPQNDVPVYAFFEDTWVYTPGAGWTEATVTKPGGLDARQGHAMEYDPDAQRIVLVGGKRQSTVKRDAYLFDPAAPAWTDAPPIPASGQIRYDQTLTHYPPLSGLIMLGGQNGNIGAATLINDIWLFQSGDWVTPDASGLPASRTAHQIVYAPGIQGLVVFGGFDRAKDDDDYGTNMADTWQCVQAGGSFDCTEESNADAPPGRKAHIMFRLPDEDRIYVHGGISADTSGTAQEIALNDTWVFTTPGPPRSSFALNAGLKSVIANETLVAGFHEVSDPDFAALPQERVGSLLLSDLDGDGLEEIAVALPGGHCTENENQVCGKVIVKDHQLFDQTIGELRNDFASFVGQTDSWLGSSVASADINGDGAKDLVVGAPLAEGGAGAMYVALGGELNAFAIVPSDRYTIQVGRIEDGQKYYAFEGPSEADQPFHLGYSVAVADFDGDGFPDVAASAPSENADMAERSAVYILGGPWEDWPYGSTPGYVADEAWTVVTTNSPEMQLGVSLAAGDVDGDGFPDLIIGTAPTEYFTDIDAAPRYGAVGIVFGGPDFFADWEVILEELVSPKGAVIMARDSADRLNEIGGVVVTTDLDGDGAAEIAATVGRPSRTDHSPDRVALIRGENVRLYRDSGQESDLTTNIAILYGPPGSGFGANLSAGDANGDRNPDLLIGAPYMPALPVEGTLDRQEAGALYVVLGSSLADYWGTLDIDIEADLLNWPSTPDNPIPIPLLILRGTQSGGFFGSAAITSSHIAQQNPATPHAYTLVLQSGWLDGAEPDKRDRGRVWTFYLPSLLPCESYGACPIP
ncbi:MAG: kelch repeat-containing protein [bacterium]